MRIRESWPRWVYGSGVEPDYRFSFANERTFLAWVRTSLALVAAGVAVDAVNLPLGSAVQTVLAGGLVMLGLATTVASWTRWARAERAMRRRRPLPGASGETLVMSIVLAAAALLVLSGLG